MTKNETLDKCSSVRKISDFMMGVYLKKKKGSLCSTASYGAVAWCGNSSILALPNVSRLPQKIKKVSSTNHYI
ncbi:MAG: hypothetical protein ACJAUL_001978 [Paraglaciecola sp.]